MQTNSSNGFSLEIVSFTTSLMTFVRVPNIEVIKQLSYERVVM